MTTAQRAELLRQRFRVKCKLPFVFTGVRKPKPVEPVRSREVYPRWQRCEGRNIERVDKWVKEPDPRPKLTLRAKKRTGAPALAKIAVALRKKLPRLYLPQLHHKVRP